MKEKWLGFGQSPSMPERAFCAGRQPTKEPEMASHDPNKAPAAHDENEPVPFMQQLLDNPFLLLFLGVMIPMIVYSLWGFIDILTVPLAK